MTFGYQCDEAQSFAILDEAFDSGITFLDAADHYPIGDERARGRTEQIIGNWMRDRGRRDDVVLGTKFALPMGSNPWDRGGSRRHVMDAIDNSLRRLGTDYVDVYQMHFPDDHTPIEETLQALDDCVKQGKVRYLGCSNFSAWQLARANGAASTLGLHRFEVIQPRYNLLFRAYERDLFDLCALDDIAVTPYNPLAGGLLTGKHSKASGPQDGTRFALGSAGQPSMRRYWNEPEFETITELSAIASAAGIGMVELSIAWVLANPAVTSPIIGASKPEQLGAALAALEIDLDDETLARVDELTKPYRLVELVL